MFAIQHSDSEIQVCLAWAQITRVMVGQVLPPEFGVGDANANCPPQILSYRYKKERSVAFKIRQNPFSVGALPRTQLGGHNAPPCPLVS